MSESYGMTVHLARKWRSKNFNELVGQDLSVRLLKNSLFKKAFFPAYLFSGLRGSGKTSMGRIFAAAVNSSALSLIYICKECSILLFGILKLRLYIILLLKTML